MMITMIIIIIILIIMIIMYNKYANVVGILLHVTCHLAIERQLFYGSYRNENCAMFL